MCNTALDLFLWTNLSIASDDDNDTIIQWAIITALNDATKRSSFSVDYTDNAESQKRNVMNIKRWAKYRLMKQLYKLNQNSNFATWHATTCEIITGYFSHIKRKPVNDKNIKKLPAFTYGNAQKFINMTIKYLYAISQINHKFRKEWYDKHLSPFESTFHIPIDNYILQYLYSETDFNTDYHDIMQIREVSKNSQYAVKFLTDKNKTQYAWSNFPSYKNCYLALQNAILEYVRNNLTNTTCPLVWENNAWIHIAKKRRDSISI